MLDENIDCIYVHFKIKIGQKWRLVCLNLFNVNYFVKLMKSDFLKLGTIEDEETSTI